MLERSDVLGYFYTHLSQLERDQISTLRACGFSFNEIGEILGRSGSTISREFRRNKTLDEDYLPSKAPFTCRRPEIRWCD